MLKLVPIETIKWFAFCFSHKRIDSNAGVVFRAGSAGVHPKSQMCILKYLQPDFVFVVYFSSVFRRKNMINVNDDVS